MPPNPARLERTARREKTNRFIGVLRRTDTSPGEFDEHLLRETVESVALYSLDDVVFKFFSVTESRLSVEDVWVTVGHINRKNAAQAERHSFCFCEFNRRYNLSRNHNLRQISQRGNLMSPVGTSSNVTTF